MLTVSKLAFAYPDVDLLESASFRLEAGCIYGLVGPNGAGKTTLFSLLKGHLAPCHGTIDWSVSQDAVGLLAQDFAAFTRLRAAESIDFLALINRERHAPSWNSLLDTLPARRRERANVLSRRELWKLSTGERRWLYIEWLLAIPDLRAVLLDEPTAGVDPEFRALMFERIQRFVADGRMAIVSTHLLDELAGLKASLLLLRHKRLEAHASLDAFRTAFDAANADEAFVKAFEPAR